MEESILNKIISELHNIDFSDAFIYDSIENKEYSYFELFSRAYYVGSNILDDSNVVVMDNSFDLLILYFAAMFRNSTIIAIDPDKNQREIDLIKSYHKDSNIINEYTITKYDFITREQILHLFNGIDYDKDFLITYTSGSTGNPKGVVHSIGNLYHSALNFGKKLNYGRENKMCHVMPMTYMAGILNSIILPFITGGKIVLFPRFSVKNVAQFWNRVISYEVNTFWLSPTMLHLIMKIDRGQKVTEYFKDRRITISVGTAPLPIALKKEFEERYNVTVYQSYGLSETLFLTTANNSLSDFESVGKKLDDVEVLLSEDCELLVQVPWMFKGYVNDDISNYLYNGYYKTGDLCACKNNELFITGRKKELIIKGGININPKDIQNIIEQIPDVNEVCVGSVVLMNEERIVCWYSGEELAETEINTIIYEQLGKNYRIDYFRRVSSLPKNLNGKIDKLKLVEEFEI
ncbi:MAG: acyl--CoA ligase [Lachnospiraceae bacterium]|nr:acyl--CoA ligase [Lachnospiraceae bacterium]